MKLFYVDCEWSTYLVHATSAQQALEMLEAEGVDVLNPPQELYGDIIHMDRGVNFYGQ